MTVGFIDRSPVRFVGCRSSMLDEDQEKGQAWLLEPLETSWITGRRRPPILARNTR
jgi:hypothetical protein